jgi:hypothetical protein
MHLCFTCFSVCAFYFTVIWGVPQMVKRTLKMQKKLLILLSKNSFQISWSFLVAACCCPLVSKPDVRVPDFLSFQVCLLPGLQAGNTPFISGYQKEVLGLGLILNQGWKDWPLCMSNCVSQLSVTVANNGNNQLTEKKVLLWLTVLEVLVHIHWPCCFRPSMSYHGRSVWYSKTVHLMAGKWKKERRDQGPIIPFKGPPPVTWSLLQGSTS